MRGSGHIEKRDRSFHILRFYKGPIESPEQEALHPYALSSPPSVYNHRYSQRFPEWIAMDSSEVYNVYGNMQDNYWLMSSAINVFIKMSKFQSNVVVLIYVKHI